MHNAGIIYLCYGCIALTFFLFTKDSAHAFNKKIRKLALKIKKFHGDNLSKKKKTIENRGIYSSFRKMCSLTR